MPRGTVLTSVRIFDPASAIYRKVLSLGYQVETHNVGKRILYQRKLITEFFACLLEDFLPSPLGWTVRRDTVGVTDTCDVLSSEASSHTTVLGINI